MKKILLIILFLSVTTTLFARKIEIVFWHSLGFHVKQIIEQMTDEYNRIQSDVKVTPVFQGMYEEMQVKMLAAAVTRQLPEVAQVQIEYLDSYVKNSLLQPVDDLIPPEEKEDILDKLWEVTARDGHIYGIPFCISVTVFFYNEDAFKKAGLNPDKPPSTWDEVIRMGKKLTRDINGDGEIDKYAMMFWTRGFYGIAPFLWANGGSFFTDDGNKINLTSEEMVKTIIFLTDFIFKHRIMPQKWTDWEGGQAFLTGNLAMGPFTSAAISYGEKNLPWKLRIAVMPSLNNKRYSILGGSALVNFTRSRKTRKAAQDFILWMTNRENTIKIHQEVGYLPVRKSALNSLELKAFHMNNPNYKVVVDSLEFAKPLPSHPDFFKINQMLSDMLQRIILNESDPRKELENTQREINRMLE